MSNSKKTPLFDIFSPESYIKCLDELFSMAISSEDFCMEEGNTRTNYYTMVSNLKEDIRNKVKEGGE